MKTVSREQYEAAGVKPVCGFEFRYNPDDAEYGVGVTTDGTIPQLTNMEEAVWVGKALQASIFGVPVEQKTRMHYLNAYTLYWRGGMRELVHGADPADAMNRAAYGGGALPGLDFYANGDDRNYEWNAKQCDWVLIAVRDSVKS